MYARFRLKEYLREMHLKFWKCTKFWLFLFDSTWWDWVFFLLSLLLWWPTGAASYVNIHVFDVYVCLCGSLCYRPHKCNDVRPVISFVLVNARVRCTFFLSLASSSCGVQPKNVLNAKPQNLSEKHTWFARKVSFKTSMCNGHWWNGEEQANMLNKYRWHSHTYLHAEVKKYRGCVWNGISALPSKP